MNQAVHQIRYCWSESSLLGTRGMGPVESTPAAGSAPHLGSVPTGPRMGGRRGAWVHVRRLRWRRSTPQEGGDGGTDGPDPPRARRCSARRMTAQEATRAHLLGRLGRFRPERAGLARAGASRRPRPSASLRARARTTLADRLADLFAQLLIAPAGGYTVIGEPDPLAVTCALGDLIGETPTFASDESADTRARPADRCLPGARPSFSSTTATRRRLSPGNALADAALSSFAVAVVDAYVTDGLDGIAAIRPDRPPANPAEVREWAQAAQFAPGVIADLTRLPKLSPAVLGGPRESAGSRAGQGRRDGRAGQPPDTRT